MDFLRILLDSNKYYSTCFMCYKTSKSMLNIKEKLVIHTEYFNITSTLNDIINYIIPFPDMFVKQICDSCLKICIEMYVMLRKHEINKTSFETVIKSLDTKIFAFSENENTGKWELVINLPQHRDIANAQKTNNSVVNDGEFIKKLNSKVCNLIDVHHKHNISHKNINNELINNTCGVICNSSNSMKAELNKMNCHETQHAYCLQTLKSNLHHNSYTQLNIQTNEKKVKRVHTKKYYHCNDCNYKSLNKNSLNAHINKTHLNIRPYVCEVCSKGFYKKSNLTEHVETHKHIGIAVCEMCGDKFLNKKTLIEHLRLHSNTKPYECDVCKKRFVTVGRRSDHFKRNHVEKGEQCEICGKRYSLRKDLRRHLKTVHMYVA